MYTVETLVQLLTPSQTATFNKYAHTYNNKRNNKNASPDFPAQSIYVIWATLRKTSPTSKSLVHYQPILFYTQ